MSEEISFQITPLPPFDNYHLGVVRIENRDNRRMIQLFRFGGERLKTTYARYLFQVDYWNKYRLLLPDDAEVDHINENKLDDQIDNLQLLTKAENVTKNNYTKGSVHVLITCPICGTLFHKAQHKLKPWCISLCSQNCVLSLNSSNINPEFRKYIYLNQTKITFLVYKSFPSGEEYLCEITKVHKECFHPNSFKNYKGWLPDKFSEGFSPVDYNQRALEFVNLQNKGYSMSSIGRIFSLSRHVVRDAINNFNRSTMLE